MKKLTQTSVRNANFAYSLSISCSLARSLCICVLMRIDVAFYLFSEYCSLLILLNAEIRSNYQFSRTSSRPFHFIHTLFRLKRCKLKEFFNTVYSAWYDIHIYIFCIMCTAHYTFTCVTICVSNLSIFGVSLAIFSQPFGYIFLMISLLLETLPGIHERLQSSLYAAALR